MTKINCKLLTSSTSVLDGVSGNYIVRTISHTIDPTIKVPANREMSYQDIDKLAREFAQQVEKTIRTHFHEGHIFNITIKDFLKPANL